MHRDSLRLLLADGLSVEQIAKRFRRHPSTVAYWMNKHGLEATNRAKYAAKGGIGRAELTELVQAGRTIAEISEATGLSKSTVRHWLRKYGLRTSHRRGRRPGSESLDARAAGLLTIKLECPHHGEAEFMLEGRGVYRCKRCRTEAVSRRRRKLKAILVGEAGGRCCICGYDRHPAALHFHHVDPTLKRMGVSAGGMSYSLEALRAEARKCVLLCSNCHAEVENGFATVPVQ
jgi:transposase